MILYCNTVILIFIKMTERKFSKTEQKIIKNNISAFLYKNGCNEKDVDPFIESLDVGTKTKKFSTTDDFNLILVVNLMNNIPPKKIASFEPGEKEKYVIILNNDALHYAKFRDISNETNIGKLFMIPVSYFTVNRLKHKYQPECSILRKEKLGEQKMFEMLGENKSEDFAKILTTDKTAMYFIPTPGDIIKFIRTSALGVEIYFREVEVDENGKIIFDQVGYNQQKGLKDLKELLNGIL